MFENEKVNHVKFGEGSVLECDGTHIKVVFSCENTEKTFAYPSVCEKFLNFESSEAQEETLVKLKLEKEGQRKLENMKRLLYKENEKRRKEEQLAKLRKKR
ncbi:MAG: hypothetical protein ACI4EF_08550 [Coprococcus sp.]